MKDHSSSATRSRWSKLSSVHQVTHAPGQAQNLNWSCHTVFVITGAFLAGVLLAIGHDRFNNHLNGQTVDGCIVPQKWVSRIATAFAFLVKMCLATATATSYFQRLWRNLKTRSFRIETVDTLMGAPTNALSFLSPGAWQRVPVLLLMGLTTWCLPFAAVISPGTLIVVPAPITNTTSLQVPQLSYNSSTWAVVGPISSDRMFWSASADMEKVAFVAAVTGQVVGASHTYANETYSLDFHAPAIRCSPANDSVQDAAKDYYWTYTDSGGYVAYYSWVGGDDQGILSNDSNSSECGMSRSLDTVSADAARIFILSAMDSSSGLDSLVTECVLHNATYSVDFAAQDGVPSTVVSQLTVNEKLPAIESLSDSNAIASEMAQGPGVSDHGIHYSYQAVMDVFGKLLVGDAIGESSVVGTTALYSSFQRTSVDWYDKTQMQVDLETLFQNITLSLFSSSNLLLNSTQAVHVPVTVTAFPLTYQYQPRDLWAAYGAAVVATLMAALIGLQSMYASGSSYSSRFSTAVRIARTTGLDRLLDDADDGSDPLPKEIGAARIQVISSGGRPSYRSSH